MKCNFEFTKEPEIITIEGREFRLEPKSVELSEKMIEIAASFKKPNQTWKTIVETCHVAIDIFLGEGAFEHIFGSEKTANVDRVMELYYFLIGKYNKGNQSTKHSSISPKHKKKK